MKNTTMAEIYNKFNKEKYTNLEMALLYWLKDYHNDYVNGNELLNSIGHHSKGESETIYVYYADNYKPLELRKAIQSLRLRGYPILASRKGYKYAENKEELQKYIAARGLEIRKEWQALKAMSINNDINSEQLDILDYNKNK